MGREILIPVCRLEDDGREVCEVKWRDIEGRWWKGSVELIIGRSGRPIVKTTSGDLPDEAITRLLDFLEENKIET